MSTIAEVLARAAADRPADAAIVDGGETISNASLLERAGAIARALVGCGVARGDAIAIWAPNCWQWIAAALGAHTVGAMVVPINTRYKGEEAAHVLGRSRARVLFTVDGFLGCSYPAMLRGHDLPALEHVVVMDRWSDFLARGAGARVRDLVTPDDVGDLMFTSGTTGRPKGVPATHAQSLRVFHDWGELVGLRRGERYLVVAPFFHTFGYKAGWLAALQVGAVVYPQPVFDVEQVLARIAADRINVVPGPPTLYLSMLAHPARAGTDLSSLRLAVTGAASIPVELVRRMSSDLGFQTVLTGYGLTETTGTATLCRAGDDAATIATTSGRAIPDVEVAIFDDAGVAQRPGTVGEIVVRGYNVMRGYWEDPAATAETVDARGWLRTGDLGTLDERGYLKITDRKKDMFIVGGFNAYPAEIEGVLLRHPGIAQAAVVGAPDERLGEVGVAFVIARPGATLDPAELTAWSRERMANYKVPRRFEIVERFPTNASGKVLKTELRAGL